MDFYLNLQVKQENWAFQAEILVLSQKSSSFLHAWEADENFSSLCLALLIKDRKTGTFPSSVMLNEHCEAENVLCMVNKKQILELGKPVF